MAAYITTLSKFVIPIWIAFYTIFSFAVFIKKTEEERQLFYGLQLLFMFLVHLTCFLTIFFQTSNIEYIFFYAFQQIVLFAFCALFIAIYPNANRLLIQNPCMLMTIGFVILTRLNMTKAVRQFIIAIIALTVMLFLPHILEGVQQLKNLYKVYAFVGVGALVAVLLLGSLTNGSKLSYTILGITFQPSEFVKILFVFFIASSFYLASDLKRIFFTTVIAAAHVLILTISNDLGSALIFFVVYIFMLFLATRNFVFLFLGVGAGGVASTIAYHLFSHIKVRVQAWIDPWSVINGQGYQIAQSLFAIGRGGLFGLGLFNGNASDIPYVEQDFIFSAIAEELGIIVASCIVLICISSFFMILRISIDVRDRFYQLVAFGIGILYIFQVFLTVGGDVKFIPLTGVTLSFVSYGGSSILSSIIMFGVIEGIQLIADEEQTNRVRQQKLRIKKNQIMIHKQEQEKQNGKSSMEKERKKRSKTTSKQ